MLKTLDVYPLFFEIDTQNLSRVLNEYFKEQKKSSSLKLKIKMDCMK